MKLSRDNISEKFHHWLKAWNDHDLVGVMLFIHDDIVFNSWDGKVFTGKIILERAWQQWFHNHGNFSFTLEDIFIDEVQQELTFSWELDWPSPEKNYRKVREKRKGVDILRLKDGKIIVKNTYSKTAIEINSKTILMSAF